MDQRKADAAVADEKDSTITKQFFTNEAPKHHHCCSQSRPTLQIVCDYATPIAEDDLIARPIMIQRLIGGGVRELEKKNNLPIHLEPVRRLDMMTEDLKIVNNDGQYAR